MKIAVVVGNPKPRSRTLVIAEAVAERVAAATGATVGPVVDLCDHGRDVHVWPHEGLAAISDEVAACELVVVASPTYKASYTGLLKAFLDRYANDGLAGTVAVPVMTGASREHAMAIDTMLRPLLVELGASVPARGLYFVISQMDQLDAAVEQWAGANLAPIARGVGR